MIRVGKIVATHGLQGVLVMTHIVGSSDWLKKEAVLFVELQKKSFIPYFVSTVKALNKEEYHIQLEDVPDVAAAKKLVGKQVYAEEDLLKEKAKQTPLLWIGFNVVDKTKGSIGLIEDVMQAPGQWLAKVIYEGKEVLVPLIEQTIIEVNTKNQFIRVDLPEGLLEVYL